MITKINKNQITRIKIVNYLTEDFDYVYQEKIKFLGITIQNEGFYTYQNLISNDDILESGINRIENKKVYILPHIVIYLSDGSNKIIYFETIREIPHFIENNFSDLNLI